MLVEIEDWSNVEHSTSYCCCHSSLTQLTVTFERYAFCFKWTIEKYDDWIDNDEDWVSKCSTESITRLFVHLK